MTQYDKIIQEAAIRWQLIIKDDLPDIPRSSNDGFDLFNGKFPGRPVNVAVDDVLIGFEIRSIDGVGSTLGEAVPTTFDYNRDEGSFRAVAGSITFDLDDFTVLDGDGVLLIAIHELAHIFGIGPVWSLECAKACRTAGDTSYTCPRASEEYRLLDIPDGTQDLQVDDGIGACAHWDANSFPVQAWTETL